MVGRPRRRHRAALADRRVRRRHRAGGDEVRGVGADDLERDRARRLRERLRARPRSRSRARSAPRLWGVRLDTSEPLVDRSLWEEMGDFNPTGVNERLVRKVRAALDAAGFERVKIVASGGFDGREDRGVREPRRAGRRVRRRLVADPRRERLHRRHRRSPTAGRGPRSGRYGRTRGSSCPLGRGREPSEWRRRRFVRRALASSPQADAVHADACEPGGRRLRDDHELTDPRDRRPARLPHVSPHCLRGTRGAQKCSETEQPAPVPFFRRASSPASAPAAARAAAAEEELRRVHGAERRALPARARPGRGDPLRRRDRHLRRRGDPRAPRPRAPRPLRRGRRPRARPAPRPRGSASPCWRDARSRSRPGEESSSRL